MDEPCSPVRNNNLLGSDLTPAILTALFSNRLSLHCCPWLLIIRDVFLWYPPESAFFHMIWPWFLLPLRLK